MSYKGTGLILKGTFPHTTPTDHIYHIYHTLAPKKPPKPPNGGKWNFLSNIGVDQYIGVETKEFGFPQIHTEVLLLPGGMQDIGALGRRRVCAGPGRGGVRRGAAAAAPHRTEQPRSSLDLVQMPRGMSCTCLRTASSKTKSSATITTIKQLPVQNTRPCTRKLYLAR